MEYVLSSDDSAEDLTRAAASGRRHEDAAASEDAPPSPEFEDEEEEEKQRSADLLGQDAGDDRYICDEVSLVAKPNAPDILIVLDRSSSMLSLAGNRWTPSVNAVKQLTQELGDVINFGLMLFPALGAQAGIAQGILGGLGLGAINIFLPPDTGCAPGKLDVPLATNNARAIEQALDRGTPRGLTYTPTSATLSVALTALTGRSCADCAQPPQYVLLVSDGEPTCTSGLPLATPADVDATNVAIDKLRASQIKTYVVGYNTSSSPPARAAMESFAQHGGTGAYIPVENGSELIAELRRITGALVACEYELNEDVDDAALVRVIIDGQTLVLHDGWHMEGRKVVLEEACERLKDAEVHQVQVKKTCTPASIF